MDTWISDMSDLTDLKTKKTICFVTFHHLDHNPLDPGNNRILRITGITWITRFLFTSCLDPFCSNSMIARMWNPVTMELRANTRDKNPKPIYIIERTSGLYEWLVQSVTQWLDQLDNESSFVCVSISRITWINGSVIHFSK